MTEAYDAGGHYEGRVAIKADPGGEFLEVHDARDLARHIRQVANHVEKRYYEGEPEPDTIGRFGSDIKDRAEESIRRFVDPGEVAKSLEYLADDIRDEHDVRHIPDE